MEFTKGINDNLHVNKSGNPIFQGYYADPEARLFDGRYWVYPTYSAAYHDQTFFDAFYSEDLIRWIKIEKVLDVKDIPWARKAVWAPSQIRYNGNYYVYFAANDIQCDMELGGIGVAMADRPEGPYKDCLGRPLIDKFHLQAQPIDPHVFIDDDHTAYLYYGGWGHCNVVKLNEDMVSFGAFEDGEVFKEITPSRYVEGPCMFKREGKYYFMWAEGDWRGPHYCVAYAISDSPLGPFHRLHKILEQDPAIGTGAGHHSVFCIPSTDDWYIVYHRRPLHESEPNNRVVCMDRMFFNSDGTIKPVVMTNAGVEAVSYSFE